MSCSQWGRSDLGKLVDTAYGIEGYPLWRVVLRACNSGSPLFVGYLHGWKLAFELVLGEPDIGARQEVYAERSTDLCQASNVGAAREKLRLLVR